MNSDISIPQRGIFLKEVMMDMTKIKLQKKKIKNNINVQQYSIATGGAERHHKIWRDVRYMFTNKRKV